LKPKILITAGGTGGHIFPALAMAERLSNLGWSVYWMGGTHGLEGLLVPKDKYPTLLLNFSGVRKKGVSRLLRLPFDLIRAISVALIFILKMKPNVVLGFGGYPSIPGGVAAVLARVPLVIHEQNSIPGLANKLLSKFSKTIFLGFPSVLNGGVFVGNPIRKSFNDMMSPMGRYSGRTGPICLLVTGGSLGARKFNELVPLAISKMPALLRPIVVHQAGGGNSTLVSNLYEQYGVDARVVEFFDDMAAEYAVCDLVISRAGALSVSEIATAGVASILIPYPFAVDDHQRVNASHLEKIGACLLLDDKDLTADHLSNLLSTLTRERLRDMAGSAQKYSSARAVDDMCARLEEMFR